jgi:hypothetical protein
LAALAASLAAAFGLEPACVVLPMLTIAGAAIGNSRRAEFSPDLSHPTAIWSAVLANNPSRLSRATQILLQPLIERQRQITLDIHARYREHVYALHDWHYNRGSKGRPPVFRPLHPVKDYQQYFFTDPDFDNLHRYLRRQPRGCLFVHSDLSHLFHAGGSQFLSLFDAPHFTFDHADSLPARFVLNAFVAITGSVGPYDPWRFSNPAHHQMACHFLLARYVQSRPTLAGACVDPQLKSDWSRLLDRLYRLEPSNRDTEPAPQLVPLVPKARPVLAAAERRLLDYAHRQPNALLQDHLIQLIDYIPRIALIHQLIDAASNADESKFRTPHYIDGYAINTAARIVEWHAQETCQIYADAKPDPEVKKIRDVLTLIKKHGHRITVRQLMRCTRAFPLAADARKFLQDLANKGLGTVTWQKARNGQSVIFRSIRALTLTQSALALSKTATVSAPPKSSQKHAKQVPLPMYSDGMLVVGFSLNRLTRQPTCHLSTGRGNKRIPPADCVTHPLSAGPRRHT